MSLRRIISENIKLLRVNSPQHNLQQPKETREGSNIQNKYKEEHIDITAKLLLLALY
jgi:hypothetical protein